MGSVSPPDHTTKAREAATKLASGQEPTAPESKLHKGRIVEERIVSRHFTAAAAHQAATKARLKDQEQAGSSSGWKRLDYRVVKVDGWLRKHGVRATG